MSRAEISTGTPKTDPSGVKIFEMLQKYNKTRAEMPLSKLVSEPGRFKRYSRGIDGLLLDYSRVQVDREVMELLLQLARERGVEQAREQLFGGDPVNLSEDRPAMHMALRTRELRQRLPHGDAEAMEQAMQQMLHLAGILHRGELPADQQVRIRNIVHVGIGGSLLGTRLLCDALATSGSSAPTVHFLGSVDAHPRERLTAALSPEETVVILVSKSFTTADTLMHGVRMRQWLEQGIGKRAARERMFAVTGDRSRVTDIPEDQILFLPEWVGGRYSLWSPVSLAAVALAGPDAFRDLLQGAAEMDRHFLATDLADNLPVLLGLLGVWHRNVCGFSSWGVIPYDHRLRLLPAHLQQLVMESTGKSVGSDGRPLEIATAPLVFGACGTDAQHSLFQAMHQGSDRIPLHLVGVIRPDHEDREAHAELLANLLAQAAALATGRTAEQTRAQITLEDSVVSDEVLAQRVFAGNRPSELLLLDDLSPANLGKLLALYEHKVFVESVIWGVNAFDQWGVELGKSLAPEIRRSLEGGESTVSGLGGLLDHIRARS